MDYAPFAGPDGLIVDKDGNLYVAVRAENRPGICVYSPEGTFQNRSRVPADPIDDSASGPDPLMQSVKDCVSCSPNESSVVPGPLTV